MTDAPGGGPPDFFSQPQEGTSATAADSANPFAAASAENSTPAEGLGQGEPVGDSDEMGGAAAPDGSAAEPIDPELFSGPPVADSYAPAGTGVPGEGVQLGASPNCSAMLWCGAYAQCQPGLRRPMRLLMTPDLEHTARVVTPGVNSLGLDHTRGLG